MSMKHLTPELVATVRTALKGKRLERFDASVAAINDSVANGAWLPKASVKANSGFYQGLCSKLVYDIDYDAKGNELKVQEAMWELGHCLSFGVPTGKRFDAVPPYGAWIALLASRNDSGRGNESMASKLSFEIVMAWVELCWEKTATKAFLDALRPKPVITPVGLSPRVTQALTEMNLDIDLSSVKPARVDPVWGPKLDINKEPMFDVSGKPVLTVVDYVVVWTPGIVHYTSRFSRGFGPQCHACGKNIPSRRYSPVEAFDKKGDRLVSLWLGCDCSAKIFGIKAEGVAQKEAA